MTGIFSSSTVRFQSPALIYISRRRSRPSSSSSSHSYFTSPRISASATSVNPTPLTKNPYEVLKVKETATVVEIKNAYRSLAKRFHPDVSGGGGRWDEFVQIHDAYATLSDSKARVKYDEKSRPEMFYHREMSTSAETEGGFGGVMRTRRWETDQCW